MSQKVGNTQIIISLLPEMTGSRSDMEKRISERFTLRLWGSTLIDRNSWEGYLTDAVRSWLHIDDASPRMQHIFQTALSSCDPDALDSLPSNNKGKLYRLKYAYCLPEDPKQNAPLQQLAALLQSRDPTRLQGRQQGSIHWSQDPLALRDLSLLKDLAADGISPVVDASLLDALFGASSQSNSLQNCKRLLDYFRHYTALKNLPLDHLGSFEDLLKQAYEAEVLLGETISLGRLPDKRPEAQQKVAALAATTATEVGALGIGQRRLIFGGTAGRAPKLEINAAGDSFLSHAQLLLSGNPATLAHTLTEQAMAALKPMEGAFTNEIQTRLKGVLQQGIAQYVFPKLSKSLLTDRSIGAKILLAPVELLRMGAAKIASSVCESLTNDLSERFTSLLGQQGMHDLYDAAMAGNLHAVIEAKLEQFLQTSLFDVRRSFLAGFSQLTHSLPSYVPDLIRHLGYGDLGEPGQPIWLEVQKQENGKFTLSVFAGGAAAYLQPSLQQDGTTGHQVVVQYCDIDEQNLDAEFFHALYSYKTSPEWNEPSSYSTSNFYNGFLPSLGVERSDLSAKPQAYSIHVAETGGICGAMQGFLHYHLGLKTPQEEETFLFNLRTQILCDAWRSARKDPDLFSSMRSSLRKNAHTLIESAASRFEMGLLSIEELKALYATIWEILQAVQDPKESSAQKPVLVPREIGVHLQSLFSSVPTDMIDTVKDLLIGASGPEAEAVIEAVANEMPPRPPEVAPTLTTRAVNLADAALNIALGVSYTDFTAPSYWSYIKITLLTVRVAMTIFFPPLGLSFNLVCTITAVAKYAITEAAYAFFPDTIRAIFRVKHRLLGSFFARAILPEASLGHFNAILRHWRSVGARSGSISYELSSSPPTPKRQRFHQILPQAPLAPPVAAVQQAAFPLVAEHQEITTHNVQATIRGWLEKVQGRPVGDDVSRYLNEQMKNLPVPLPQDDVWGQDDIWSEVQDVHFLLENMAFLALTLYRATNASHHQSQERRIQVKLNLYKAYAIIDKLARRCPESRLDGFTANGWALATCNKEALLRLYDKDTREQLAALQQYFGVDPEEDAMLDEESPKVQQASSNCLFFRTLKISEDIGAQLKSYALEKYLQQFLDDPDIVRKLAAHGVTSDDPYIDRIHYLHADPAFRPQPTQDPALLQQQADLDQLFLDGGRNPRKGILPRPFHLLHLANLLANAGNKTVEVRTINDDLVVIKARDNNVRKFLHAVTFGQAFGSREHSSLDLIPGAKYVSYQVKGREHAWSPLASLQPSWDIEEQAVMGSQFGTEYIFQDLSRVATNFLHMPSRQQKEIVSDVSSFSQLRRKPLNFVAGAIGGFFDKIFKPRQLHSFLSDLPPAERRLIEMLRVDPKEQAVRTLSYFSQRINELHKPEFLLLLRVFLLQNDVLYPYLQEHPEFAEALGDFFKMAIGYYAKAKNWGTSLALIEVAILARAEACTAAAQNVDYFPDLRAQLLHIRKMEDFAAAAGQLLALPWLFIDPQHASAEQIALATHDIALSRSSFQIVERRDLADAYDDLSWKWRPAMQEALDNSEILRNSVLNAMAVEKGLLASEGNPLQWQGAFPVYRSGMFTVNFEQDFPMRHDDNPVREMVTQELLPKIFGSEIPAMEPLQNGCYLIPSQDMGIELRQTPGEERHRLAFFKTYRGQKFYWSRSEQAQDGLTYWVGEMQADGFATLLILDKGNFKETKRLRQGGEPELFDVMPAQTTIGQEQCELVDLSTEHHSLGLLTWFQPLSTIHAYRSSTDPKQIRRIEFTALDGVAFNVVDGVAVGEGALSGLTISPEQMPQNQYPALGQHARYLLLQNSSGAPKVALPADTLRSAAAAWLLKKTTNFGTSQLIDSLLDPLLNQISADSGGPGYYLYDFDEDGHLTSSDPDAVLHLLCYHLAQNSFVDVRRDLLLFESLGRRKPFSDSVQALCTKVQLSALGMNDPEITRIALRLGAIAEENRLLQGGETVEKSPAAVFISWLALQGNYYANFVNGRHSPHLPLDEYQELFILHAIAEYAKEFTLAKIHHDSLSTLIDNLGIDMVVETVLMHPKIAERYYFLRQKYALPEERESLGVKSVLRSLMLGTSTPGASQSAGSSTVSLISSVLAQKRPADNALDLVTLEKTDLETSWEDVPLAASQITNDDWVKHMHAYYLLACGVPPADVTTNPEKLALFQQRRQQLKRMLDMLTGKLFDPTIDPWIDVLRLASNAGPGDFPEAKDLALAIVSLRQANAEPPPSEQELEKLKKIEKAFILQLSYVCKKISFLSSAKQTVLDNAKQWAFSAAKAGALSYVASYVSMAAPLVPMGIAAYKGYGAYARERDRLHNAAQEAAEFDATGPAEEAPLPQEMHQLLTQQDGPLGEACTSLLESHFKRHAAVGHQPQEEVAPFDIESNDQLVQKYFGRLNQSLTDFYARPPQDAFVYEPQDIDHFHRLGAELQRAKIELQTLVNTLKQEVITFSRKAEHQDLSDDEIILGLVRDMQQAGSSIDNDVYFYELIQAFGRDDLQWLTSNTKISLQQMPQFEQMMYRYLIHATRLHQIERAGRIWESASHDDLESAQNKIRLKQLCFELTRKRAYAFNGPSARLVRANLLFEYGTKLMLWEKQVSKLQEMLLGPERRVVLQLIMGMGKSSYGIPMTSFFGSDGNQAVYNFFPDALAAGCTDQTSSVSSKVFGQAANAVQITRNTKLEESNLWALLRAHMRAIQHKEHFNGRKKDLQALELRFIEAAEEYRRHPSPSRKKILFYYMKLLGTIRKRERANVDEAHRLFRRNEELNHPMGAKKQVQEKFVQTIIECARHLSSDEEIAHFIRLQDDKPPVINPAFYHAQIKPRLAEKMSHWPTFAITDQQRPIFVEYLCGSLGQIPQFVRDHPQRSEIGLTVGVLNKILPDALQRRVFVDYGPSEDGNGEYARPYNGNESPNEQATIKNPFEAVLKTCIQFLHTRLNEEQVGNFVRILLEMAEAESQKKMIPIDLTTLSRSFSRWCQNRYSLADLEQGLSPEQLTELTTLLNQSDGAVLAYTKFCVVPDITYFSKNLKSDSHNFASMFSAFYSDTASPNRDGTFPVGTRVRWDDGTTGDFVDFVCTTCDSPDSICVIDSESPRDALKEILDKQFKMNSKASAIIDTGAEFTGLNNETVAKEMLDFITEHRPDIDGIVFFNKEQEIVVWKKGDDRPVLLSQNPVPLERRLTYFDQIHTVGADIPQPLEAIGVTTLSSSSTIEDFAQGGGRMRGLKTSQQRLRVVVNQKTQQLMSEDEPLTMRKVVAHTQKMEASTQGQENYLAARQKIANIIRRAILDGMEFAPDVDTAMKYLEKFADFLIPDSDEDPFSLYGLPEVWVSAKDALDALKKAQFALITSSGLFSAEQQQSVWEELEPIGHEENTYPDRVPVYNDQGNLHVAAHDLGASQEVAQSQNQDQAQQVQQNQNQEQQQDVQVDTVLPKKANVQLRNEPARWDDDVDYFSSSSWLKPKKFDAPVDHRRAVFYTVSGSHSALSTAFRGRMWWSNNFLGIRDEGTGRVCKPLSRLQMPILELLVVREQMPDGSVRTFSGAIDQYEAQMWRRRCAQDRNGQIRNPNIKIALYDLALQAVVDSGRNRLDNDELISDPEFCADLVRWKFLAGQTQIRRNLDTARDKALLDAGREWLSQHDLDMMKQLFLSIYKKHGIQRFAGSDMHLLLQSDEPILV